jgi:hypothetical protein
MSLPLMIEAVEDLHRLLKEGKDESPEADAIRDRSDAYWKALTEEEKAQVRQHSQNLYGL